MCCQITGNTIQMHVVTDAYAARVSSLHMYDAVRWVVQTAFFYFVLLLLLEGLDWWWCFYLTGCRGPYVQ